MAYKNTSRYESTAVLVRFLQDGHHLRTEVYDPEKSQAAGPVLLHPDDAECSGCDTVIDTDEYPGAAWANILARQKLKYGHTMCQECHEVVSDG